MTGNIHNAISEPKMYCLGLQTLTYHLSNFTNMPLRLIV